MIRNPFRKGLLALAFSLAAPSVLWAAPLEVNHHSFEKANFAGANSWTNDLVDPETAATEPQWVGRDGNESGDAFLERIDGFAADGINHVGMATGYYLYQDTGITWEANRRYRLTVAVGNRNESFTTADNVSVVGLTNNTGGGAATTDAFLTADALLTEAHATFNASSLSASTFQDVSVTFDTGARPPAGTVVVVVGDASAGGRSHFDHVRLQAGPIPLIDLDAAGLPQGPLASWESTGSLTEATFQAAGDPQVTVVDQIPAVHLDGQGDWFVGPIAPESVTGANPRTVEAWVHNFTVQEEETVFAWGRRGGPEGSNVSFNHGSHPTFGAVGHWGAPDIGWNGRAEPDIWTHIAYTQDGTETRVYVNGILSNQESGITLATHSLADDGSTPLPFVLGNQNEPNGTQADPLAGSLSVAKLRVYDQALDGADIHASYQGEAASFGRATFEIGGDQDEDGLLDDVEMVFFGNLEQDGAGDLDSDGLTNAEEATLGTDLLEADSDQDGVSDGDEVAGGSDPLDPASVPSGETQVLVHLDAAGLPEGVLSAWENAGTLGGTFVASGDPTVETIDGAQGVTLDGEGDWLVGPPSVPSIEGASGRSIEAWVYNPEIADEETVVSWGRRGGPDGSNVSFNHGAHPEFGAVGHWGAPDIGWDGDEEAARWSHIVYTQDGSTTRVYTNGVLSNSEEGITLNTHSGQGIVVGAQWDNAEQVNEALSGSLSVGLVRVFDGALADVEVANLFNQAATHYGRTPLLGAPLVELDARGLPGTGPLTAWTNTGTLGGEFVSAGDPTVEDIDGVRAVSLDGTGDWLVGPVAPDSVTGSAPRTVEAWIKNPTIDDEETVFAWGRRGGPDGSNVSFNHGAHPTFGAVGHWGAPDIGWEGDEEADIWTHITYTQTGSETRVYTNGLLSNSETIAVNTHTLADDGTTPLPFVLGNQNEPNGTQTDPLSGSMSVALVRVYDQALNELQVAQHYNADAAQFGRPTFVPGADEDQDGLADDYELAIFGNLDQTGDGDPDDDGLDNAGEAAAGTNPLVADSDGDGASDKAEVDAGTDPLSPTSFPALPVNMLVELEATTLAEGPVTSWTNTGTLGGAFVAAGDPVAESIEGAMGVTLDGDGDWLVGPDAVPGIEGASDRTITAWIFNPEIAPEETVVSWGRRGGPDGTNMSFNHGTHNAFGAVGHWGNGPDIGWDPSTGVDDADTGLGQEEAGVWTFIAYTQDGATTRVYTNGVLTKEEAGITLNTHAGMPILVGSQWEPDGVTPNTGLAGSLSVGELRIYDGALSSDEIASQFSATSPGRPRGTPSGTPGGISGEAPSAPQKAALGSPELRDTIRALAIRATEDASELTWSGIEDGQFVIEYSTTLQPNDWQPVGSAESEGGTLSFLHQREQATTGFYRIRLGTSTDEPSN